MVVVSHLVKNMFHVSFLMVWPLTSSGNNLGAHRRKYKAPMRMNASPHFSKVTYFFQCCCFKIAGIISFNHNRMLLTHSF